MVVLQAGHWAFSWLTLCSTEFRSTLSDSLELTGGLETSRRFHLSRYNAFSGPWLSVGKFLPRRFNPFVHAHTLTHLRAGPSGWPQNRTGVAEGSSDNRTPGEASWIVRVCIQFFKCSKSINAKGVCSLNLVDKILVYHHASNAFSKRNALQVPF